jgi:hypothetical protein
MQTVGVLKSSQSVSQSGSHKRLVQEATEAAAGSNNNNNNTKDSILFQKLTFQTCTKQLSNESFISASYESHLQCFYHNTLIPINMTSIIHFKNE